MFTFDLASAAVRSLLRYAGPAKYWAPADNGGVVFYDAQRDVTDQFSREQIAAEAPPVAR